MTRREEKIKEMVDTALDVWDFDAYTNQDEAELVQIGLKSGRYNELAIQIGIEMRFYGFDKWIALDSAAYKIGHFLEYGY